VASGRKPNRATLKKIQTANLARVPRTPQNDFLQNFKNGVDMFSRQMILFLSILKIISTMRCALCSHYIFTTVSPLFFSGLSAALATHFF